MVVGGPQRDTSDVMSQEDKNSKLEKVIRILKFLLTIDDLELLKSSIESVIDELEEEIDQ